MSHYCKQILFPHPRYVESDPTIKSVIRSIPHKIMLVFCPFLFYILMPEERDACHFMFYAITCFTTVFMLITSTYYHHFEHKPKHLSFYRKLDIIAVALFILSCIVPPFMHYRVYNSLWIIGVVNIFLPFLALLTNVCSDRTIVKINGLILWATCTSSILWNVIVYQDFNLIDTLPIITHSVLFILIMLLYIFADNDEYFVWNKEQEIFIRQRPIIATHDVLHILSIVILLTSIYFNRSTFVPAVCASF